MRDSLTQYSLSIIINIVDLLFKHSSSITINMADLLFKHSSSIIITIFVVGFNPRGVPAVR